MHVKIEMHKIAMFAMALKAVGLFLGIKYSETDFDKKNFFPQFFGKCLNRPVKIPTDKRKMPLSCLNGTALKFFFSCGFP